MALKKPKIITIIRDDREKEPWDSKYLGSDFKIETKRLKTGDYTIKGMEDIICIERKNNWQEIAVNIGKASYKKNFLAELKRMQEFPVRILVINDDYSALPHAKMYSNHVTPVIISNWMLNLELEYGISVIPLGRRSGVVAKHMTRELFKRVYEYNRNGRLYYHVNRYD